VTNDGITAGIRGSGIGLALVAQIARSHRGKVWVEGNTADGLERGACFVFELPVTAP
jgi:signal transduction histidine kinase